MTGHTPGPWVAHQYGIRDVGGYICALKWPSLYTGQDDRYWKETAERQADARLIAASPDLLHACRLVTENAPHIAEYIKATDPGAFAQIQGAIKKATQP